MRGNPFHLGLKMDKLETLEAFDVSRLICLYTNTRTTANGLCMNHWLIRTAELMGCD